MRNGHRTKGKARNAPCALKGQHLLALDNALGNHGRKQVAL